MFKHIGKSIGRSEEDAPTIKTGRTCLCSYRLCDKFINWSPTKVKYLVVQYGIREENTKIMKVQWKQRYARALRYGG